MRAVQGIRGVVAAVSIAVKTSFIAKDVESDPLFYRTDMGKMNA